MRRANNSGLRLRALRGAHSVSKSSNARRARANQARAKDGTKARSRLKGRGAKMGTAGAARRGAPLANSEPGAADVAPESEDDCSNDSRSLYSVGSAVINNITSKYH